MATHKTKPEYIDAIQFNGNNGLDIQSIAGVHYLDAAKHYPIPNFDYADYWWPQAKASGVVAVVWTEHGWKGVRVGDFLCRYVTTGYLDACTPEEFATLYDVA